MLGYYLELGFRSLRRNAALTALMVIAIGFGIAASMVTYAVFRAVSGDPIPQKSAQLFTPLIDNWGPQYNTDGQPKNALSYTDATALMHARKAEHQTLLYGIDVSVSPQDVQALSFDAQGYATSADFFGMFEVPFLYGGAWRASDDDNHAAVAVISQAMNDKLFGGTNSVGHDIVLDTRTYRIVGVTQEWNPVPRFYDLFSGKAFADPAQVYVSYNRALDLQTATTGYSCGSVNDGTDWNSWLHGECVWLKVWVELAGPKQVADYRQFLTAYAALQQHEGRFHWTPNVRLYDVNAYLDVNQVVPPEASVSLLVAVSFFVICIVNTIGLLLAKFMRRSAEIAVRRALGASRIAIYCQYLVEAGTVGLAGGLLGLILTYAGMFGLGLLFKPEIARLAHVDFALIGLTLGTAVLATVVAAFYPTWRASRVQPAWQLKSN
jgi:putative ABC transport system permease protein